MKRLFIIAFLFLSFLGCKNFNKNNGEQINFIIENKEKIVTDWDTWYNYFYSNIHLAQDFVGLDIDSSIINKKTFLEQIINENVFPVKVSIKENIPYYKLYN